VILLVSIGGFAFFQGSMFMTKQKIADQQIILDGQNKELAMYKNLTWYIKLSAVRDLEKNTPHTMPWAERIDKIIKMLTDLRNITPTQNETIALSDFDVSLDKISLKGKVSSLLLLYYNDPSRNIVSLLDRFQALDFIKDLRIQTYDRNATDNTFGFVLEANVTADDGTK
jgi:hypothetical protein